MGLDPDGPVDGEAAGPEGAALGQLEPQPLEPRRLRAGVTAVERVARCDDSVTYCNCKLVGIQYSAKRRRLGCVISRPDSKFRPSSVF